MEVPFIIQMLALGLTVSQLFNHPADQFQQKFDPTKDQEAVAVLLREGCEYTAAQMEMSFDELKETVAAYVHSSQMANAANAAKHEPGDIEVIANNFLKKNKLDENDLSAAFDRYCLGNKVENTTITTEQIIAYYNKTLENLEDVAALLQRPFPQVSTILDGNGQPFTEMYKDFGRRRWIALKDLPPMVGEAFVAAEDKNFREHIGIDLKGIFRVIYYSLKKSGKTPGGSTITQQLVKNILNRADVSVERKMREMVQAVQLEKKYTKDQILEFYLNYIYLGRASWGIEMASQSYFKHSAKSLNLNEIALLVGLAKGPDYYSPDKKDEATQQPLRALSRRDYVLGRLKEDQKITAAQYDEAMQKPIVTADFEPPLKRAAFYFLDDIKRNFESNPDIQSRVNHPPNSPASVTGASYQVSATIDPLIQRVAVEETLQDKLAEHEANLRRAEFTGPVGSIAKIMEKTDTDWEDVLPNVHSNLYDVHWPLAVVLKSTEKNNRKPYVGLTDGRVAELRTHSKSELAALRPWDLIHVRLDESGKEPIATLLLPPKLQGAVIVMEAKTGRILGMSGGFSYAASQLNRATDPDVKRQPGSTFKPFLYMAALNMGYQENTNLPNLDPALTYKKGSKWAVWNVHNFDGTTGGKVTLRQAVERSMNQPAAQMMSKMDQTPEAGLKRVVDTAMDFGVLKEPTQDFATALGAKETHLVDLAAAYAAIANITAPYNRKCPTCLRPVPTVFDDISLNGESIYHRDRFGYGLQELKTVDRVSVFQMRRILEGTVRRGTAVAAKELAGYVAGKTGTTNGFNDAWFVGFTNDIVVATWVGYDNNKIARSYRNGENFTGARLALPIAADVFKKIFKLYPKLKQPLADMPPDLNGLVVEVPIEERSSQSNQTRDVEAMRVGAGGRPTDTQDLVLNKLSAREASMLASSDSMGQGYDDEGRDYEARGANREYELPYEDQDLYRPMYPSQNQYRHYVPGNESPIDYWSRGARGQMDQGYYGQNPYADYGYGRF